MTLIIIPQLDADICHRHIGIEQITGSQFHAIVEEILKDGSSELLLEGFLEGTLVGANHRGKLV